MVDKSISVSISAQDNFSTIVQKFQKELDQSGRKTNKFGDKQKSSFRDVTGNLKKFQSGAQSALGMLTRFAPALAPLGAALGVKELASSTLKWGDNIRSMAVSSKAIGVPISRLNALSAAAEQVGGSGDAVKGALSDLSTRQTNASHGLDPQFSAQMKQLGIAREEWTKLSPDKLFERINARLREQKDLSKQATAAQVIYAGNTQGILPILQENGAEYKKHVQDLEKQYALSKDNVQAFSDLANKAGELEQNTKAIGENLAAWAAPGLTKAFDFILKAEKSFQGNKGKTFSGIDSGKNVPEILNRKSGKYAKMTGEDFLKDIKSGFAGDIFNFLSGSWVPKAAAATIPNAQETSFRKDIGVNQSHFKNQKAGVNFKNPNAVRTWNALKAHGYSDIAVSGMMASANAESGFSPSAENSVGMQGIFQWNKKRQKEFKAKYGKEIKDSSIEDQANFADYELKKYPYLGRKELQNSKTAQEAAYNFPRRFERPDEDWNNPVEANTRSMTGEDWLKAAQEQQGKPQEMKLVVDVNHKNDGTTSVSVKAASDGLKIGTIKQQQSMHPASAGI